MVRRKGWSLSVISKYKNIIWWLTVSEWHTHTAEMTGLQLVTWLCSYTYYYMYDYRALLCSLHWPFAYMYVNICLCFSIYFLPCLIFLLCFSMSKYSLFSRKILLLLFSQHLHRLLFLLVQPCDQFDIMIHVCLWSGKANVCVCIWRGGSLRRNGNWLFLVNLWYLRMILWPKCLLSLGGSFASLKWNFKNMKHLFSTTNDTVTTQIVGLYLSKWKNSDKLNLSFFFLE